MHYFTGGQTLPSFGEPSLVVTTRSQSTYFLSHFFETVRGFSETVQGFSKTVQGFSETVRGFFQTVRGRARQSAKFQRKRSGFRVLFETEVTFPSLGVPPPVGETQSRLTSLRIVELSSGSCTMLNQTLTMLKQVSRQKSS